MVQTVAPERPDQALNIWILPGRPRGYWAVTYAHRPDSAGECMPVGAIIIAHQVGRRPVPRERLHDLLRQPLRRRVPGHREPEQPSSTMTHDETHKQALECHGWNHTQIDRRDGVRMVAQECPPCLRWRSSVFDHVGEDGRLRDVRSQA